jgi:hypothetical protein
LCTTDELQGPGDDPDQRRRVDEAEMVGDNDQGARFRKILFSIYLKIGEQSEAHS